MLNNWREDYRDQQMAEKYINSFQDDIAYDRVQLDSIISSNEKKLERIKTFITSLKNNQSTILEAERIMGVMAEINPFLPKLNTYESIKNSGNLNILTNYEIKEKLIQYYQSLEGKKLIEEMNMLYITNYIIPFIHEHADFLNQRIINRNVLKNHNFTNLVLGYYQLLTQTIDSYKSIFDLNKELEQILVKR